MSNSNNNGGLFFILAILAGAWAWFSGFFSREDKQEKQEDKEAKSSRKSQVQLNEEPDLEPTKDQIDLKKVDEHPTKEIEEGTQPSAEKNNKPTNEINFENHDIPLENKNVEFPQEANISNLQSDEVIAKTTATVNPSTLALTESRKVIEKDLVEDTKTKKSPESDNVNLVSNDQIIKKPAQEKLEEANLLTTLKTDMQVTSVNDNSEYELPKMEIKLSEKQQKEISAIQQKAQEQEELKMDDRLVEGHNAIVTGKYPKRLEDYIEREVSKITDPDKGKEREKKEEKEEAIKRTYKVGTINAILEEVEKEVGETYNRQSDNPFGHNPDNSSATVIATEAQALNQHSTASRVMQELEELPHSFAPVFPLTKHKLPEGVAVWRGIGNGSVQGNVDEEDALLRGDHDDGTTHRHPTKSVNLGFDSRNIKPSDDPENSQTSNSFSEGLEGNVNLFFYDENGDAIESKGNSYNLNYGKEDDEQRGQFFTYHNLGGNRKSFKGASFQSYYHNEDSNINLGAAGLYYLTLPKYTIGFGPIYKYNILDDNNFNEFGVRGHFSNLFFGGKVSNEFLADVTNKSFLGELKLASDVNKFGATAWHLSLIGNMPYNNNLKPSLELDFDISKTIGRNFLIRNETEVEFGEGWNSEFSTYYIPNKKWSFGVISNFGKEPNMVELGQALTNDITTDLGIELGYRDIPKGFSARIEAGTQDLKLGDINQPIFLPYVKVGVTKAIGK
jgi:hypothetical protein